MQVFAALLQSVLLGTSPPSLIHGWISVGELTSTSRSDTTTSMYQSINRRQLLVRNVRGTVLHT